jgi:cell shape-determining protein MreD
MDLFVLTPFGLTALAYLMVGYAVGLMVQGVIRNAFWIPLVSTFVATVGGLGFYVILGQLLGQQFRVPNLLLVLLGVAIMNTALIYPTLSVARWINKAIPERMMARHL